MGEMIYTLDLGNGVESVDVVHDEYCEYESLCKKAFENLECEAKISIQTFNELNQHFIEQYLIEYYETMPLVKRWNP